VPPWYNDALLVKILRNKNHWILAAVLAGAFMLPAAFMPAQAATLGERVTFNVNAQYDFSGRTSIQTSLLAISEHAYFFIEDSFWQGRSYSEQQILLNKLITLGTEFDARIYPIETSFFGSEPNPGLDGDSRVYIVFSNLIDTAGGYIDTTNQYSKQQLANSNEHELIFLNARVMGNELKSKTFLAHEFQHLISFQQRNLSRGIDDDIWINEMRSEYAVTLLGYNEPYDGSNLDRRVDSFNNTSTDSLTAWPNADADYGQIDLFGQYLVEHYGQAVLQSTMQSRQTSGYAINEALNAVGVRLNFGDVFLRWAAANWLNDASSDTALGYSNVGVRRDLKVPATRQLTGTENTLDEQFQDWQARWLKFSNWPTGSTGWLKVNFISPQLDDFRLVAIVYRPRAEVVLASAAPAPDPVTVTYFPVGSLVNGANFDLGTGITQIILIPAKMAKLASFGLREDYVPLRISTTRQISAVAASSPTPSVTPAVTPAAPSPLVDVGLSEGSLVQAQGDYRVYQIGRGWKRHILNPTIFRLNNWSFNQVITVAPAVLALYPESNLLRYDGNERVYLLDTAGIKHWLDMSGDYFVRSGRNFAAVFTIGLNEFSAYRLGNSIAR